MDRVRGLVAAGVITFVLAQERDRLARTPAYHYLPHREFEEAGYDLGAIFISESTSSKTASR
jgi:hypothetical protein